MANSNYVVDNITPQKPVSREVVDQMSVGPHIQPLYASSRVKLTAELNESIRKMTKDT